LIILDFFEDAARIGVCSFNLKLFRNPLCPLFETLGLGGFSY